MVTSDRGMTAGLAKQIHPAASMPGLTVPLSYFPSVFLIDCLSNRRLLPTIEKSLLYWKGFRAGCIIAGFLEATEHEMFRTHFSLEEIPHYRGRIGGG